MTPNPSLHPGPASHDPRRAAKAEPGHTGDEPPPVLGNWRRIYLLVAVELVVLIALFYLFTKTFE